MDYELALELKNAGFPQMQFGRGLWVIKDILYPTLSEKIYAPTLEELIEACGDGFGELIRLGRDGWSVTVYSFSNVKEYYEGRTPVEAVARLWMALKIV